jgi:hypothetical protein
VNFAVPACIPPQFPPPHRTISVTPQKIPSFLLQDFSRLTGAKSTLKRTPLPPRTRRYDPFTIATVADRKIAARRVGESRQRALQRSLQATAFQARNDRRAPGSRDG